MRRVACVARREPIGIGLENYRVKVPPRPFEKTHENEHFVQWKPDPEADPAANPCHARPRISPVGNRLGFDV